MSSKSFLRDHAWVVVAACLCVVYGVMYATYAYQYGSNGDFDIISEVSRRVAAGGRLYVDAIDQRGPLMYLPQVLRWHLMPDWHAAFLAECVCCWVMACVMSFVACRIVHETGYARYQALAVCGMLVLWPVIFMSEVEMVAMPGALVAVLLVARVIRGTRVPSWGWVVVGLFAGHVLWSKFPLCLLFVIVWSYGAMRVGVRRMLRPLLLALAGVAVMTVVALAFVAVASDFRAMLDRYLLDASSGYFSKVVVDSFNVYFVEVSSLVRCWNIVLVSAHVFMWLSSSVVLVRSVSGWRRRVVLGVLLLVLGVFCLSVTFKYYHLSLLVLWMMAVPVVAENDALRGMTRTFAAVVAGGLVVVMMSIAPSITNVADTPMGGGREYVRFLEKVRDEVGDDRSIMAWYFVDLGVLCRFGLETPYATPAPNNVVSARDELSRDVYDRRWRWILVTFDSQSMDRPYDVGDVEDRLGARMRVALVDDYHVLYRCENVDESRLLECDVVTWPPGCGDFS